MAQLQLDGKVSIRDQVLGIAEEMPRNFVLRDLAKRVIEQGVFEEDALRELTIKGVMEQCKRFLKAEHPHHKGLPRFLPVAGDFWVQLTLLTKDEAFEAYTNRESGILQDVVKQRRFREYLLETFGDAPPALVDIVDEGAIPIQ